MCIADSGGVSGVMVFRVLWVRCGSSLTYLQGGLCGQGTGYCWIIQVGSCLLFCRLLCLVRRSGLAVQVGGGDMLSIS